MTFRAWVLQDWTVNAAQPETQVLLAWFRLAQWAEDHWGAAGRLVTTPYWLITSLLLGFELPATARVGPRLRVSHRNGIVVSHHATLGSDCQLRHGVTIGNKTDRAGKEIGVARVGDDVDLGAGCAVIGDIEVGDHARIGALAVVTRSVPAWAVVAGNPGRVIRVDRPEGDRRAQRTVTR
jgi:putative colanic acid biosynthesis acetyltransferase WcaB